MAGAFAARTSWLRWHLRGVSTLSASGKPHGRRFSSARRDINYLIDEPIEEELNDRLKNFYLARPDEILDGRFKIISKLGYGAGLPSGLQRISNRESPTWTSLRGFLFDIRDRKNWTSASALPRFVSIKIAALDTDASGEAMRSKLISTANPSHDGMAVIRTSIDQFKIQGPNGTHFCLVYEPMRETLFDLQHGLRRQRLPFPLFKFFTYCLFQALDYLHTECRLIHTDIKDDNIMVTIESDAVLNEYVDLHRKGPHYRHVRSQDGRVTYLSQPDFGPLRGSRLVPKLSDFDLSFPGLGNDRGHIYPIQSHRYRAPEVLLGCPWSYSADIWNMGLLMWSMLEDTSLFERPAGEDGEYDAHAHLAQMIALLGDPPVELIKRERLLREHRLPRPIVNLRGREVSNMNGFWGGPFFDDDGRMIRKDLLLERRSLEDTVTEVSGEEKAVFLDFASGMLRWLPEDRKTAKELLQHPFFDSVRRE